LQTIADMKIIADNKFIADTCKYGLNIKTAYHNPATPSCIQRYVHAANQQNAYIQ